MRRDAAGYRAHRATAKAMGLWIAVVVLLTVLYKMYWSQSDFFSFGPSERLEFFEIKVHTWWRYTGVVVFLVCTQALKVFADETISPFILNEIMQHSQDTTVADNFSYLELQWLCQSYYVFSGMAKLVAVFVSLARADLVLAILCTDVAISMFTTDRFLNAKGLSFAAAKHECVARDARMRAPQTARAAALVADGHAYQTL